MSRDVAVKFAKDFCHILNLKCSNLMTLFAGAINITKFSVVYIKPVPADIDIVLVLLTLKR